MEIEPAAPPPPGWYDDGSGAQRWWDGYAWGPVAPASDQTPEEAGQLLSVLSWAGFFVFAVVLPLVVYLTEGKKNRYTRWHSAEAFNLQLTFLIAWILAFVAIFVTTFATAAASSNDEPSAWVAAPFLGMFVFLCLGGLMSVVGVVKAWRGRYWRCPVAIPFIRAHRVEGPPAQA